MQTLKRAPAVALVVAGLTLVGACTDVADPIRPQPEPPGGTPATPIHFRAVDCIGDVRAGTVTCGSDDSEAEAPENALVVGGQNRYVTLSSQFPDYDGTAFTFNVNLRNLIPQPLGTANGSTLDPQGVRVFFHTGPTVTSGSGEITVVGDGTDVFTGANQPYYRYDQVLQQYQLSAWKTWRLKMPPTVDAFSFTVYVAAAVPFPDGWVEVQGNPSVRSGLERQLVGIVRTAVGNVDSTAAVTWSTADPYYAAVGVGSGLVRGYRAGSVAITAATTSGPPRTGTLTMTVLPITRVWTAAQNNNWNTGSNWLPDGIAPVATDTAVIPADLATYPVLTANATVGTIQMEGNSTIQMGSFNLVATGSVTMPAFTSSSITSTVGRLELAGTARTVNGRVSRVFVTGTYSLTGNLTVERRIDVQGGRLTNTWYRIQQNP
jgi:hypothetical protein